MGLMDGVICAIITPYEDDEARIIDRSSLRNVCNHLIDNGIDGIMVGGTNGEGNYLSVEEKVCITEIICDEVKNRVPVIVQAGMMTTDATIDLISRVREYSIDAVTILTPYFFLLDDEALYLHYKKIADKHRDVPVYLYNIPSHTVNHITPEMALKVSRLFTNFQGIKYSHCNMRDLYNYIKLIPAGDVFIGCDFLYFDALMAGARGIISGNVMAFPGIFKKLYHYYKNNQIEEALVIQRQIREILQSLEKIPSPAAFKEVLYSEGVIKNSAMRAPLRKLNQNELENLNEIRTKFRDSI